MPVFTPAERRGATVLVVLLALGAAWDLWVASHPRHVPLDQVPPVMPPPSSGPGAPGPAAATGGGGPRTHGGTGTDTARVDLNRADPAALEALPGIGPVLARRIVEHRERIGPFTSPDDLLAVPGIGPGLLSRLAPRVRCGPARP